MDASAGAESCEDDASDGNRPAIAETHVQDADTAPAMKASAAAAANAAETAGATERTRQAPSTSPSPAGAADAKAGQLAPSARPSDGPVEPRTASTQALQKREEAAEKDIGPAAGGSANDLTTLFRNIWTYDFIVKCHDKLPKSKEKMFGRGITAV